MKYNLKFAFFKKEACSSMNQIFPVIQINSNELDGKNKILPTIA